MCYIQTTKLETHNFIFFYLQLIYIDNLTFSNSMTNLILHFIYSLKYIYYLRGVKFLLKINVSRVLKNMINQKMEIKEKEKRYTGRRNYSQSTHNEGNASSIDPSTTFTFVHNQMASIPSKESPNCKGKTSASHSKTLSYALFDSKP